MRTLLDRYIRSLAEREKGSQAPEQHQDLGTYLGWLLPRLGFTIHLQTFKHEGAERRLSAGRMQWGCDLVASKTDLDGEPSFYRFVLKRGDIRRAQWLPGSKGSMPHDLWLAAGMSPSFDQRHAQSDLSARIIVVAVHNGDLDTEDLGDNVETMRKDIESKHGTHVEWWDAARLVDLTLAVPTDGFSQPIGEVADSSLFPPHGRPFVRLTLDSLSKRDAADPFDFRALEHLLNTCLPIELSGDQEQNRDAAPALKLHEGMSALRMHRTLSELSLFVEMLAVETRRIGHGNTLPMLDTTERLLCRALAVLSLIPPGDLANYRKRLREVLEGLVEQYIQAATSFLGRFGDLLETPGGLAFPLPSEPVDYPLRTLRFSGYLSTAGLALLDQDRREEAELFASAVEQLWRNNQGGCLSPVADDQIIETCLAFELWLRSDRAKVAGEMAALLIARLAWRSKFGFPLPALWLRAAVPMTQRDLNVLIDVYATGRQSAPRFDDRASTLLSLAVYVAHHLGPLEGDELLQPFLQERQNTVSGHSFSRGPAVHPESWQPPEDAAKEWYYRGISSRGVCRVHSLKNGYAELLRDFDAFNRPVHPSPAETDWGFPVVDRIAWKLHRTPPPMEYLIQLVQKIAQPPSNENA